VMGLRSTPLHSKQSTPQVCSEIATQDARAPKPKQSRDPCWGHREPQQCMRCLINR